MLLGKDFTIKFVNVKWEAVATFFFFFFNDNNLLINNYSDLYELQVTHFRTFLLRSIRKISKLNSFSKILYITNIKTFSCIATVLTKHCNCTKNF